MHLTNPHRVFDSLLAVTCRGTRPVSHGIMIGNLTINPLAEEQNN